jgi:hypothetical protein
MREGRSRAARSQPLRLVARLAVAAACLAACASGCAAEVNTLEPEDNAAGEGGTGVPVGAAGKPANGGAPSMGTAGNGTAGSKVVSAFGGTASSGGAAGSSGDAGGGGKAQGGAGGSGTGGTAGAGGAKNGGAGGQAGTGGTGQGGTAGSSGSAGAGGGANLACLKSWKGDACDVCSKETQADHLACVDILNCYAANSCGPATCGNNDDKCGANKIGKGTAGYPIAQKVYDCLCK